MFSTYDGAKRLAKKLRKIAFQHGADLSLNVCQKAIAGAGGYRDWQHLRDTLEAGARSSDPEVVGKRLRTALPMLSDREAEAVIGKLHSAIPAANHGSEFRELTPLDVWMLHRRHQLFRQGSGAGLQMRQNLMDAALQQFEIASYDEKSCTIAYDVETLREIFGDLVDDPRFHGQLTTLIGAGVFALDATSRGVVLKLLPPPRDETEEHLRSLDEYERQRENPHLILRPTELTRAQRAMLEEAREHALSPDDREWVHNDLTTLLALLVSGTVALAPMDDGRWRAAITEAGEKALLRRRKPAQDAVEATFLRCHLGRLIVVGPGAEATDARWHRELSSVPADGEAIYVFARRHGLAVFGALRS